MRYVYFTYPRTPIIELEAQSITEADAMFVQHQKQYGPVQPIALQWQTGCMPRVPVNNAAFPHCPV